MKHRTGWSPDTTDDADAVEGEETANAVPLIEVLRELVANFRAYAQTEAERGRLRARIAASAARDTALLVIVALFLLFGTIVALLVGAIFALSQWWGPVIATLVVISVALVIALLLSLAAWARAVGAFRRIFPKDAGL